MKYLRWVVASAVVVILMTATACQQSDQTQTAGVESNAAATSAEADSGVSTAPTESSALSEPAPQSDDGTSDESAASSSPLADADLSLPPARRIDELAAAQAEAEPAPTSISIERIGLNATTIRAVGVESNGDMTVPEPLDVGWYRYGPMPGESGSAVLAGHIASGGVPGAFRHLDQLQPGDLVTVGFDDGSSLEFTVDELLQIDKTELPFDTVFARSGPSKLALITCGGEFDYDARSYTDNVVITASPVAG